MKRLHLFFLLSVLIGLSPAIGQQAGFNCYTLVVGEEASQNGSLLIAHNEDDHGENLVNWFKVPRKVHDEGETITLHNGAVIPQVDTTYEYLWLEMPGMEFADSYMNEHGVTIASNACPSREDQPELTDGGIGYWLRRLMAERGSSAREAVQIGGELVEKYGYASSGRTYTVADQDEAWVMSVVNGKHWVAQRVPDNKVMIIPNYYTITSVNLSNDEIYMGSDDLVSYAKKRGWYEPKRDGAFNFRKVYGNPQTLASPRNIPRKWRGLELLTGKNYEMEEPFPFAVKPKEKITRQKIMKVLADHYEGTEWDESQYYKYGNPHAGGVNSICAPHNQYGFVAELRKDMPVDIGAVMWLAPRRPCIQPYVPWYFGMAEIPGDFALTNPQSALENHFYAPENILEYNEEHAFAEYAQYAEQVDAHYGKYIEEIKAFKSELQEEMLKKQDEIEKKALKLYDSDKEASVKVLFDFTKKYLDITRDQMDKIYN
ncbi:MAG: C69 family dipeptidase [Bacteroidales bacterium]|nr:C69 family dipeptidase [Bacteroidales bacterium]